MIYQGHEKNIHRYKIFYIDKYLSDFNDFGAIVKEYKKVFYNSPPTIPTYEKRKNSVGSEVGTLFKDALRTSFVAS